VYEQVISTKTTDSSDLLVVGITDDS